MKIILVLIVLFLVSCSHFINDESLPVVQANYPSLEIKTINTTFNGLAIIEASKGSSFKDLNISVQGYYEGRIRIFSSACNIDDIRDYEKNRAIKLDYDFKIDRGCIFSITMDIVYPKTGEIVTHPLKGHISVVLKDQFDSINQTLKMPHEVTKDIKLEFNEDANVLFSGCDLEESHFFKSENGIIKIRLTDYLNNMTLNTCQLIISLKGDTLRKRYRYFLAIHSNKFSSLSNPNTNFGDELEIVSEDAISVISVGNKYKIGQAKSFKWQTNDIIRLISNKGRLLIGKIIKKGEIEWIR